MEKSPWKKPSDYTQNIFGNDTVVCEATFTSTKGVRYDLTIVRDGRRFTPIHGMERMKTVKTLRDAKIDLLGWYHVRIQTD